MSRLTGVGQRRRRFTKVLHVPERHLPLTSYARARARDTLACMKKRLAFLSVLAVFAAPAAALAAVDASLIPDGTYIVKVEKVNDAQHLTVVMNNGIETTLSASGSINFSSVKANQTIKVSVVKGKVPVFAVQ